MSRESKSGGFAAWVPAAGLLTASPTVRSTADGSFDLSTSSPFLGSAAQLLGCQYLRQNGYTAITIP
jgi:hypothetical protein